MSLRYLGRRLVFLVLTVWAAATINFFVPKISPRNPIMERLQQAAFGGGRAQTGLQEMIKGYERDFGFDKPLWQQYLHYLTSMLRLDFGYSLAQYPRKVMDVIGAALPWTIGLVIVTTVLAFLIGTILGALIAWQRAPRWIRWLIPPLMTLRAMPFYLTALILIYFFAFQWRILPLSGAYSRGAIPSLSLKFILDLFKHYTLPALSIIATQIGAWALGMRGLMVMTQGEDYITYAEARGLKPARIFRRYAMRNALLPQLTGLLLSLGFIIFGAGLVEVIFGIPGLGSVVGAAISSLDYFVIYGTTMILVISISIATLLMDLIYPLLDPRITYERG